MKFRVVELLRVEADSIAEKLKLAESGLTQLADRF